MNEQDKEFYKKKEAELVDRLGELRAEGIIKENKAKCSTLPEDTVYTWTVYSTTFSQMYLKHIAESIDEFKNVIHYLENLTPTGVGEFSKADTLEMVWNHLDNAKTQLKSALGYSKIAWKKEYN